MNNKPSQKRKQNSIEITEHNITQGNNIKMEEYLLSSGVKVLFHRLPEATVTEIMTQSFSGMKFDDKGNLRDTKQLNEQLVAASKVQKYHTKLIARGVELVGTIDEYTELEGIGRNWLNKLKQAEEDFGNLDLNDEYDLQFLFLRHYGFKKSADFEALSKYTLGQ